MTISMLFVECVKLLSSVTASKSRSYEIEILPSSKTLLPSMEVIKLVTIVPASRPSGREERLWWGNRGSRRDVEHTRSNLG